MVDAHLGTRLEDSIQKALRSYTTEFKKEAQAEKKRYIDLIEKLVKDIINNEVKTQLPQILPKAVSEFTTPMIKSTITESLEDKIPIDKMEKSQSNLTADEQKELYKALDKDEDPPARSVQWMKRQKTSKDTESTKGSKSKESKSTSSSKGTTRSQPKSSGKSAQVEELNHLVRLVFNLLKGTCRIRVELGYNIEEFYKAVTDGLDWNNLEGKKYLFDLSKPLLLIMDRAVTKVKVMKWYDYGYLEEIKVRREDQRLYKFKEGDFLRLHLHDIEEMLLLLVQKKLFNLERDVIFDLGVALRMFTRRIVILKRVEDLQLGVESYQKKLNITKPETFRSDISNRTPYTAYNNPQGIIYEDKYKRNRLMRTDELYKFSDETITSVRSVLHDIALNLRLDYLPKRRWSSLDRKRSRTMIKAIDQQLLERRLMRRLEKFVGGRDYGEDLRLLQRTI
ncbi:hypothetical protein Tco_0004192 [Tanacetum coccineum]